MSDEPTVDDMMVAYSEGAIKHARECFNTELDYSVESVRAVEKILGQIYDGLPRGIWKLFRRKVPEESLWALAKMYGGYVGEVMKRRRGGNWAIETGVVSPDPLITLRNGEDRVFPPAKAMKRLINGPEDDLWMYFQVVEGILKPVDL